VELPLHDGRRAAGQLRTHDKHLRPAGRLLPAHGCRLVGADVCAALGGVYSGDDTTCSSCPAPGACCMDGGCTQLTQAACATAGGNWQGANSPCPTASYSFGASSGTFTDISANGTNVTSQLNNCDDGGVAVSLPFDFTFFGNVYSEAWFCSNGFLQFGTTHSVDYNNLSPPSSNDPGNAIYALWDDLYTCDDGAGGNLYYQVDGTAPNRTITFSWQDVPKFSDRTNGSQNFQVLLYETSNNVEFRYGSLAPDAGGGQGPGGGDYTIGVETPPRRPPSRSWDRILARATRPAWPPTHPRTAAPPAAPPTSTATAMSAPIRTSTPSSLASRAPAPQRHARTPPTSTATATSAPTRTSTRSSAFCPAGTAKFAGYEILT